VKGDLCLPNKAQIAHEILAYLSDHPDAEDTLEGIVQWWLLERKIKYQRDLVKEAISELIKNQLIVVNKRARDTIVYRLNRDNNSDGMKFSPR
jgi:hypothetical protein